MDEMTKTYKGTRSESTADYGAEAPFLTRDGWEPVTTVFRFGAGFWLASLISFVVLPVVIFGIIGLDLVIGGLAWFLGAGILIGGTKGSGSLRVTFRRQSSSST